MGEPPYPATAGAQCAVCWGIGKPWAGPPTPKFVICSITGVERGDGMACLGFPEDCDPIGGVLEQDEFGPCIWKGEQESIEPGFTYMISWSLTGVDSVLEVKLNGLLFVFLHRILIPCQTGFTNQNVPPACYTGGGGSVT